MLMWPGGSGRALAPALPVQGGFEVHQHSACSAWQWVESEKWHGGESAKAGPQKAHGSIAAEESCSRVSRHYPPV